MKLAKAINWCWQHPNQSLRLKGGLCLAHRVGYTNKKGEFNPVPPKAAYLPNTWRLGLWRPSGTPASEKERDIVIESAKAGAHVWEPDKMTQIPGGWLLEWRITKERIAYASSDVDSDTADLDRQCGVGDIPSTPTENDPAAGEQLLLHEVYKTG